MMKFKSSLSVISIIMIMLISVTVGGWSVSEILSWFGIEIPMFANMIIGLIAARVSIPVAIVGYLLRMFGVF